MASFFKLCKYKHSFFKFMYKTFAHHSRYWTLFLGFLQTNITPIVFYASIQFNLFFSFDSVSKANLVFTLLIFFSITLNFLLIWSLVLPIILEILTKSVPYSSTSYSNLRISALVQDAIIFFLVFYFFSVISWSSSTIESIVGLAGI